MADIFVHMRDGSVREFRHTGRPGGSYTKRVRYEGNFAVITDEWDGETAIPADLIDHVQTKEMPRW